jgi:hypothetical protein
MFQCSTHEFIWRISERSLKCRHLHLANAKKILLNQKLLLICKFDEKNMKFPIRLDILDHLYAFALDKQG